jgi:hypothetical protein
MLSTTETLAETGNNKLPHLAWEIKSGLDLAEKGKQGRIKGLVDAAIALREARLLLKADVRFSQWCTANEFGPDVLNAHDRAALIAMADDPERMRSLLTNSERQSARYIYQHEWSATNSGDAAGADDSSENRFAYADKPQEDQQKQQFRSEDRKRSNRGGGLIGAPDRIRTCGLCLRRATLYPAELRAHQRPS